jgi:hypothetical protein
VLFGIGGCQFTFKILMTKSVGFSDSYQLYVVFKGKLISKGILVSSILTKNEQKNYDTSGQIVFVHFLEELRIPKSSFEIN